MCVCARAFACVRGCCARLLALSLHFPLSVYLYLVCALRARARARLSACPAPPSHVLPPFSATARKSMILNRKP